jgi:hypothetical protein
MATPDDNLIAFLAREWDAMNPAAEDCPDDNLWSSLDAGLISPGERDALVAHAQTCGACRRRVAEAIAEWPADVRIPETAPAVGESDRAATPESPAHVPVHAPSRDLEDAPRPLRIDFRRMAAPLALAAALLLGVVTWLAWPARRPDASILGTPNPCLTDTGRVGILQRQTLAIEPSDQDSARTELLISEFESFVKAHPGDADAWLSLARARARRSVSAPVKPP